MTEKNYHTMYRLIVTLISVALVAGQCHNGWIRFQDSCYLFTDVNADWNVAEVACIDVFGGYLVEIESAQENSFLRNQAKIQHSTVPSKGNTGYWIGGTDIEVEGNYIWMKSKHPFSFTDWESGNPSNTGGHEDCVHLNAAADFRWNDAPCSRQSYYICEMPSSDGNEIIG